MVANDGRRSGVAATCIFRGGRHPAFGLPVVRYVRFGWPGDRWVEIKKEEGDPWEDRPHGEWLPGGQPVGFSGL